jgi:hypothetical protein
MIRSRTHDQDDFSKGNDSNGWSGWPAQENTAAVRRRGYFEDDSSERICADFSRALASARRRSALTVAWVWAETRNRTTPALGSLPLELVRVIILANRDDEGLVNKLEVAGLASELQHALTGLGVSNLTNHQLSTFNQTLPGNDLLVLQRSPADTLTLTASLIQRVAANARLLSRPERNWIDQTTADDSAVESSWGQHIPRRRKHRSISPRGVILAASSDLVTAVGRVARHLTSAVPIDLVLVLDPPDPREGGVPAGDFGAGSSDCVIAVATPRGLRGLVERHQVDLSRVDVLFLENADELSVTATRQRDSKFLVSKILQVTTKLLVSCDRSRMTSVFARSMLNSPLLSHGIETLTAPQETKTLDGAQQFYVQCETTATVEDALVELLSMSMALSDSQIAVFTRHAAPTVDLLERNGLRASRTATQGHVLVSRYGTDEISEPSVAFFVGVPPDKSLYTRVLGRLGPSWRTQSRMGIVLVQTSQLDEVFDLAALNQCRISELPADFMDYLPV